MKLVLRKLDVEGIEELESLVTEHIDSIEPGLRVVDTRLFLGHATIDVVALDASGSLVLVALGFQADEHLLLRVVEAYSWCLEYPDAVRRNYPSVRVSEERPPRVMFVIDRMPDAFNRKIKQLNFGAVDCVEFRHIDVNGVPAMYFETVARLRRGTAAATTHEVVAAPPQIVRAAAPRQEKVAPVNGHGAESSRVRFIEIPTAPAKAETIDDLVEATGTVRHANGIAGGSDHVAVIETAPVPVVEIPTPVAAPAPIVEIPVAVAPGVEEAIAPPAPAPAPKPEVVPVAPPAVEEPTIVAEVEPAPIVAEVVEAPVTPAAVAPETRKAEETERGRISFAQAVKGQEIGGLQFPKDGALTRQWIEFLNQLSAK